MLISLRSYALAVGLVLTAGATLAVGAPPSTAARKPSQPHAKHSVPAVSVKSTPAVKTPSRATVQPTATTVSKTTRQGEMVMEGAPTGADCPTCHQQGDGYVHSDGPPTLWTRVKYKWKNYCKPAMQETHWGYADEFNEKPLGYWVMAHGRTQVANGEAARMCLYEMDFEQDSDELSFRGQQNLAKIGYMAARNFFPIIIEPTPTDPELAERRRVKIAEVLQASNFPVPAERLVVAKPITAGGYDFDSENIFGPTANTGKLLDINARGGIQTPQQIVPQSVSEQTGGGG